MKSFFTTDKRPNLGGFLSWQQAHDTVRVKRWFFVGPAGVLNCFRWATIFFKTPLLGLWV